MKHWWLVVALLLSLGINLGMLLGRAWPGRGQPVPGPPPDDPAPRAIDRPPPIIFRMATELGLEGEKRAAFAERQWRFLDETLAARDDFVRLQAELRHELVANEPDRPAIDTLLERIAAAHVHLERVFVDNLLDTKEFLDRDQERRYMRLLQHLRSSAEDRQRLRKRFPGLAERGPWAGRGRPPGRDRPGQDRPGQDRPGRRRPGDPPPPRAEPETEDRIPDQPPG